MSQTIIRPTRAGSVTQLTRSTGTSNWSCVDEATSNGDTDFVCMNAQTQGAPWRLTDAYGRTAFSTTGVSSIVSVTVYATARKMSGVTVGNLTVGLYLSGVGQAAGSEYALDDAYENLNHTAYSHTYLLNPWTGVAWTPAELATTSNVQLAIDLETDSATEQCPIRCTQVYGVIEWRPVVRKVTITTGSQLRIQAGSMLKVS